MQTTIVAVSTPQREWLRGIGIFLCALASLAVLDAIAKDVVQRNSAPMVNMVRYMVVLGLAIALMLRKGIPMTLHPPQRKLLLWRGIMLGMVGNTFMPALQFMPLAEATAIYFSSPLIIVALSPWLLKEHVRLRQWLAVAAGFGGMLLIVRPGGDLQPVGTMLMMVAAIAYSMVQILTRKLSGKVGMEQQFFYTAVICMVMTAFSAALFPPQEWPSGSDLALLFLVGLFSAVGQYLLIRAFQTVPASALAPFNYFHLLLAVIFSIVFFGQQPDIIATAGMMIIAAAGLSLTLPMLGTYMANITAARSESKRRRRESRKPQR
jgi:drug/metabolite transporter (DMT)-like permease